MAGICSTTQAHEFEVDIAPDVPKVLADQAKMTQVVLNLLSNAIKYSPEGGTIRIAAEAADGGNSVVVRVSDQGIGLAPEDKDRVFETFYRVKSEETYEIRGTGLGLFIVKSLVEGMGGEMGVESELGSGSTFYFTLPTKTGGSTINWREQNAQSLVG
jgi:signal transduction histidine kinase